MSKSTLYDYRYPEYSQKLRPLRDLVVGMIVNLAVLAVLCIV